MNDIEQIKKHINAGDYTKAFEDVDISNVDDLYAIGIDYLNNSQITLAENVFKQIIFLDPDHINALNSCALAIHYGQNKDRINEAIDFLNRAKQIDENFEKTWNNLGVLYAQIGQDAEAITYFSHALELLPNYYSALINKASSCLRLKNYNDCYQCCKKIIDDNKVLVAEAHMILGQMYYRINEFSQCFESLSKSLELNVNLFQAWYFVGLCLKKIKEYEDSITAFKTSSKINPSYMDPIFEIGYIYLDEYNNKWEAAKCFNHIYQCAQNNIQVLNTLGEAYERIGRYGESLKIFDSIIEIDENFIGGWINKGITLNSLAQYEEALECYDRARAIDDNNATVLTNIGNTYTYLEQYDDAIFHYEKAIDHLMMVDVYISSSSIDDSADSVDKYIAIRKFMQFDTETEETLCASLIGKGNALNYAAQYQKALKCFDQVISLGHENEVLWFDRGLSYQNLSNPEEALLCFNNAIKHKKQYTKALYKRGEILYQLERYEDAIASYNSILEYNNKLYDRALFDKAIALAKLKRYNESIECFQKYYEMTSDYEALHNIMVNHLNTHEYKLALCDIDEIKKTSPENIRDLSYISSLEEIEELVNNSIELFKDLQLIDEKFLQSMRSNNLKELAQQNSDLYHDIYSLCERFQDRAISHYATELLESKQILFKTINDILLLQETDSTHLNRVRDTFKKWNLDEFIIMINSWDIFFHLLGQYDAIDEITKDEERKLLGILHKDIEYFEDVLTQTSKDKISSEYVVLGALQKMDRDDIIIYERVFSNREVEWVKFCVVQLDFMVENTTTIGEFGFKLRDKEIVKQKVMGALQTAQANNVNIICFPELSFSEDWIDEIKTNYPDMIIIGGSYYVQSQNVCSIIINGVSIEPPYKKIQPSPFEKSSDITKGMRSGSIYYVFETKYGRFSVLTCIDFVNPMSSLLMNHDLDYVINICYDPKIKRFQKACNDTCENYGTAVIQTNKASEGDLFGRSCLIAKEHNRFLENLKRDNLKPDDEIKYKLIEADGEMLMIFDYNIKKKPPPSLDIYYDGLIKVTENPFYVFKDNTWIPKE